MQVGTGASGKWAALISDTKRAPADFKLRYLSCHLILEINFDQTGGGALGINNERRPNSRLPPSQLVLT